MALAGQLKTQLQQLIGRTVYHQGTPCRVVEILEGESSLVLQAEGPRTGLQDSQFGTPGRVVSETYTLPIFNDKEGGGLNPELLALGLVLRE